MNFRTLEYFLTIVREENISKAANILHITQPTLSRQMSQLEDELGMKLFHRGKRLSLTESGILFKFRAQELLDLMLKMQKELKEQSELSGIISIGAGVLMSSAILAKALQDFHAKHPKVHFEYYVNSSDHIKERLDNGLLNFGLLIEPVDIIKYDYIRMKEKERLGLFVSKHSLLASKEKITKEDLLSLPSLIGPNRLSVQNELESWLGDDLSKLNIFATSNIITDLLLLVKSDSAYALAIEGATNFFESDDIVFKPLYPELSLSSVFVWKKSQPLFATAAKFLEFFKSMQ